MNRQGGGMWLTKAVVSDSPSKSILSILDNSKVFGVNIIPTTAQIWQCFVICYSNPRFIHEQQMILQFATHAHQAIKFH